MMQQLDAIDLDVRVTVRDNRYWIGRLAGLALAAVMIGLGVISIAGAFIK